MADGFGRNFLLLQGPHGPFFRQLGQLLEQAGKQPVLSDE
jgi:capsular polysaccharide export protein